MAQKLDNEIYRVIMDGYILAGADKLQVTRKLKRLFGTSEKKILDMFDGQPTIIKNKLPKTKAYQYLRTITNAGAACHIDKLYDANPEETTQLPVHIERSNIVKNIDPLNKIKKRIEERNNFSEVMRQEILEMDQARKKSDIIITSLFASLFLILLAAAFFLFLS